MPASLYDIPLKKIDGTALTLADYRGKVLLIVNVASKCGLTPQYQGLESLYQEKRAAGLEVLGFPANNFAGQEPGTDSEIQDFCTLKFDVHFPLFSKISVLGEDQHPLYAGLTSARLRRSAKAPFAKRSKAMASTRRTVSTCSGISRSFWSTGRATSLRASRLTWRRTMRACYRPSTRNSPRLRSRNHRHLQKRRITGAQPTGLPRLAVSAT